MSKTYAIGYAHNGTVRNEFMLSLFDVAKDRITNQGLGRLIHGSGPYIFVNRNNVVRQFIEGGDEQWLLFVDNDIAFHPEHVDELLHYCDPLTHRIVAGLYFTWMAGVFMPCWFESLNPPKQASPEGDGPKPLASCGMGFTAIHRRVFEDMQRLDPNDLEPWFGHDRTPYLHGIYSVGEDATFCMRAAALGIQTWGVPDVAVDHYKVSAENRTTYAMRRVA